MREKKNFGKRNSGSRSLPSNENLRNTFGVVNKGCDSEQIISFINKTCEKDIFEQKKTEKLIRGKKNDNRYLWN